MEISGVEFVERKVCKKIKINCVSLKLHEEAEFCLHYLDENENEFKRDYFKLKGDDYQKWGDCDDYVYHYACKHYGLCNEEEECEEVEDVSGDVVVLEDASGDKVEVDLSGAVFEVKEVDEVERKVREEYENVIQKRIEKLKQQV